MGQSSYKLVDRVFFHKDKKLKIYIYDDDNNNKAFFSQALKILKIYMQQKQQQQ